MVYRAEGTAGRLAVAYEFAVNSSLLRAQMVTQDLVETLQANTFRFFFLIIANLRSTPDALDQKGALSFSSSLVHLLTSFRVSLPMRGYAFLAAELNAG